MIRIVSETTYTPGSQKIIDDAKDRLETNINKTKSKQGTKLKGAIDTTLSALSGKFNKETAIGFASAMDVFGVNLLKAADWTAGLLGVGDKFGTLKALIPRIVFDSWIYAGVEVDKIREQLWNFWDKNKNLHDAIRNNTSTQCVVSMDTSALTSSKLIDFFINGSGEKTNYGKYEAAFAFLSCNFKKDGMPEESEDALATLAGNALDVMWKMNSKTGGRGVGCEVKNNNVDGSGFNLKGTQNTKTLADCSYFTDYPGSLIVIYDEQSRDVCICRSVDDLTTYVTSTERGGVGSREGMWMLKKNWQQETPKKGDKIASKVQPMDDDPEEKYPEGNYRESYEVIG